MVTGSTYHKELLFKGKEKLDLLTEKLLSTAEEENWDIQAWAVFPNHYHFIASSSEVCGPKKMVAKLHTVSAIALNKIDLQTGRKVWFQFWDTALTFEKSYFARLAYVHQNPVKHGWLREPLITPGVQQLGSSGSQIVPFFKRWKALGQTP